MITNNPRNAGRKKKFTEEDIKEIKRLMAAGVTINEIARKYRTSRQVVSRYISRRPENGFTLRIEYMYRQKPCTIIDVDFLNRRVEIENRTQDMLHRAFGVKEDPDWEDFEYFLADRCFPAARADADRLLEELGIDSYDPLQIVEKTRGKTAEDSMWLKFAYYPGEAHNEYN